MRSTVKIQLSGRQVTVEGTRGKLVKDFSHLKIDLKLVNKGKTVRAEQWFGNRAAMSSIRTVITHIKNMFKGVQKGFLYRMKIVYSHFPISVAVENGNIEIRNFLGEKYTRSVKLPGTVIMERPKDAKDEITFSGNDIDEVSKVCADIHGVTRVTDKDIRKFLDGIYVSQKTTVVADE